MSSKQISESMLRYSRYLGNLEDITLIILRGHLLVEAELNEILRDRLVWSNPVLKNGFTFSSKLKIVKGLLGEEESRKLKLESVDKLNKLRNMLAHNLSPQDDKGILEVFLNEELGIDGWDDYSNSHKLKLAIGQVCARLCTVYAIKENN